MFLFLNLLYGKHPNPLTCILCNIRLKQNRERPVSSMVEVETPSVTLSIIHMFHSLPLPEMCLTYQLINNHIYSIGLVGGSFRCFSTRSTLREGRFLGLRDFRLVGFSTGPSILAVAWMTIESVYLSVRSMAFQTVSYCTGSAC